MSEIDLKIPLCTTEETSKIRDC